ncbi:MAG: RhuM family protein, partial [Thermodesulfobacteriota bacterium]|nr:RhuM family protein [Thermodesulfobacteriota bacterium]
LYRQVLDLYATSVDYNPKSKESVVFFKTVQNKLHYATNKQTAAETICSRVDAEKDFMGLATFSGSMPIKAETTIAKNYLNEDELFRLNRMVSAFFDLAEIKAREHTKMYMHD